MAFSYTLFLALLLLAPGFAFWAGLRLGESRQILSPASDRPGSTTTLLTVVVGALLGHLGLAVIFALQSLGCDLSERCIETGFDPNVYRVLLSEHRTLPSDAGVAAWFLALLFPALLLGICGWRLARSERFSRMVGPTTFGWLWPIVEEARAKKGTILAYVVTTLNHESRSVGYEGAVEQVAFDDNKAITMLVLSGCDRFLVDVTKTDVVRIDTSRETIELLHVAATQIANVAFEVFTPPGVGHSDEAAEAPARMPPTQNS
jgi:hypothetical protein